MLRWTVVASGILAAILFVVIGPAFHLQLYGDGSLFSYSVAVQDVWAFHWRDIAVRSTVYLTTLLPAECVVQWTGRPELGITAYGVLFFSAPLAGLAATFAADRTPHRKLFGFACVATAVLCPLVFGFPTELWIGQALFWPALALAQPGASTRIRTALLAAVLVALVLTHEAALLLAAMIVATQARLGLRSPDFLRVAGCGLIAVAAWLAIAVMVPPGEDYADVRRRAALAFFDPSIAGSGIVLLLGSAIAAYAGLCVLFRMVLKGNSAVMAFLMVCAGLGLWWSLGAQPVHAEDRYYCRTVLFLGLAVMGWFSAGRASGPAAWSGSVTGPLVLGLMLVLLVHGVETARFVAAWRSYQVAVARLARGSSADPDLGDPHFVSSARIAAPLQSVGWMSTTPYLSAILRGFSPERLVVDPTANYFWLSCPTATANMEAAGPRATLRSRDLIRVYSCLHRP